MCVYEICLDFIIHCNILIKCNPRIINQCHIGYKFLFSQHWKIANFFKCHNRETQEVGRHPCFLNVATVEKRVDHKLKWTQTRLRSLKSMVIVWPIQRPSMFFTNIGQWGTGHWISLFYHNTRKVCCELFIPSYARKGRMSFCSISFYTWTEWSMSKSQSSIKKLAAWLWHIDCGKSNKDAQHLRIGLHKCVCQSYLFCYFSATETSVLRFFLGVPAFHTQALMLLFSHQLLLLSSYVVWSTWRCGATVACYCLV